MSASTFCINKNGFVLKYIFWQKSESSWYIDDGGEGG